eukprot:851525-Rhodomonas_salina.3
MSSMSSSLSESSSSADSSCTPNHPLVRSPPHRAHQSRPCLFPNHTTPSLALCALLGCVCPVSCPLASTLFAPLSPTIPCPPHPSETPLLQCSAKLSLLSCKLRHPSLRMLPRAVPAVPALPFSQVALLTCAVCH